MSSNQEKILNLYSGGTEENRDIKSRYSGMEFYYTKKILSKYIKKNSDVVEIGCATGYFGMHFANSCKEYVGIDLCSDNIDAFNVKINNSVMKNLRAEVGDATCLHNVADKSFDVVLCLGPMYHLPDEERESAFKECKRIAREGAVIAFSYINGIGVYAGACANDKWRSIYPNKNTNKHVFEYKTDDEKPGVFFFTSPEEMEETAKRQGLEVLENHGLDFLFFASAVDMMSDEKYGCFLELTDRMCENRFCTGLANHALLICKNTK